VRSIAPMLRCRTPDAAQRPTSGRTIGLSVAPTLILSATLLFGCSREKCFDVNYNDFIAEYGDADDRVDRFCQDRGYDKATDYHVGNLFGTDNEICCHDNGLPFGL